MYSLRKMWVPIYFKDVFCPFIQSTSRSESTNSYFKDFVIPKDTLENFMRQFQVIREASTTKEDENRFTSLIKEPTYCTQQKIERQAAKIYNRDIFVKMQTELYNSGAFAVQENIKDYKYTITKSCYYSILEFYKKRFTVEVDKVKKEYKCECTKLTRDGILCCHVLRLFTQLGINELPEKCINRRWTKKFREEELKKHKIQCIEASGCTKAQKSIRYAMVNNKVIAIWNDVCNNGAESKEFLEELEKFHEKIVQRRQIEDDGEQTEETWLKDPPVGPGKSVNKGNCLKHPSNVNVEQKNKKEQKSKKTKN